MNITEVSQTFSTEGLSLQGEIQEVFIDGRKYSVIDNAIEVPTPWPTASTKEKLHIAAGAGALACYSISVIASGGISFITAAIGALIIHNIVEAISKESTDITHEISKERQSWDSKELSFFAAFEKYQKNMEQMEKYFSFKELKELFEKELKESKDLSTLSSRIEIATAIRFSSPEMIREKLFTTELMNKNYENLEDLEDSLGWGTYSLWANGIINNLEERSLQETGIDVSTIWKLESKFDDLIEASKYSPPRDTLSGFIYSIHAIMGYLGMIILSNNKLAQLVGCVIFEGILQTHYYSSLNGLFGPIKDLMYPLSLDDLKHKFSENPFAMKILDKISPNFEEPFSIIERIWIRFNLSFNALVAQILPYFRALAIISIADLISSEKFATVPQPKFPAAFEAKFDALLQEYAEEKAKVSPYFKATLKQINEDYLRREGSWK